MKLSTLSLSVSLALCCPLAQANMTESTEQINTKGVSVTATRVQRELLSVPISVSVVNADDIAKSSAATVGDALKHIPGISLSNDGSQGLKRVGIRGENAYRTLVLVDGQKISEHKSMSGSPMLISTSDIERIEVIKGPNSVLYGADAIGGVVNIITKKAENKPFSLELGSSYDGSGDIFREYANLSGKKSGFTFRLSASKTNAHNLKVPHKRIENTGFKDNGFTGLISYDFTDKVTAGINFDTFDSDINSSTEDMSSYEEFGVNIPVWKRNKVNAFALAKDLTDSLALLRFDAYHQLNEKIMSNHVKTSSSSSVKSGPVTVKTKSDVTVDSTAKNRTNTNGLTVQSEWQLNSDNYLIVGSGLENDSFSATSTSKVHLDMTVNRQMPMSNVTTSMNKDVSNSNTRITGGQRTYYGFISNESSLPFDLVANYGLRYTNVKTDVDTNSSYDLVSKSAKQQNTGESSESRTVFNAGIVWSGLDDTSIRANFGQGFRTPILQEKFVTTTMGGSTVEGNPDLKAETSNSFELGLRHISKKVFVDVSTFITYAKDFITTKEVSAGYTSSQKYYNVAKAKTFGVEISASYDFDSGITPYLDVTYLRRQFNSGDSVGKTYNSNTPKLTARYGLKSAHNFGSYTLGFDTYCVSSTSRKYTKLVSGTQSTTTQAGYTTANFETYVLFGENDQYRVSAAWLNMFNKNYYLNDTAIPESGSHAVISFSAKY